MLTRVWLKSFHLNFKHIFLFCNSKIYWLAHKMAALLWLLYSLFFIVIVQQYTYYILTPQSYWVLLMLEHNGLKCWRSRDYHITR